MASNEFDIVFIGQYTNDTVFSALGTRHIEGGTFNYGANVAIRMGLKTAVVTRLSEEDSYLVYEMRRKGIEVFQTSTPVSTSLRIEYPSLNTDQRIFCVTNLADPFTVDEVKNLSAKAFAIGSTFRGEVPLEILTEIKKQPTLLSVTAAGYLRTIERGGILTYTPWPEKDRTAILSLVDVIQIDAIEAEFLTGEKDLKKAAQLVAGFGPKEVVLTHHKGVMVFDGTNYYDLPFVDPNAPGRQGRGSTVIGAYMCKRISATPAVAAVWAAAVTSVKMEADGVFNRSIHDVEELIQRDYQSYLK